MVFHGEDSREMDPWILVKFRVERRRGGESGMVGLAYTIILCVALIALKVGF